MLLHDLRYALRGFIKRPGFAIIAIVTLSLGIGATTAIFSVVQAVLLRPLEYPHAGRLVKLNGFDKAEGVPGNLSPADFLDFERDSPAFARMGANGFVGLFTITGGHGELFWQMFDASGLVAMTAIASTPIATLAEGVGYFRAVSNGTMTCPVFMLSGYRITCLPAVRNWSRFLSMTPRNCACSVAETLRSPSCENAIGPTMVLCSLSRRYLASAFWSRPLVALTAASINWPEA